MGNVFLLSRIERLLLCQLGRALPFKLAVVAGIEMNALVLDVRNPCAHTVEKVPVMRNDQQYARVCGQLFFQPENGRQVEVVGGLIQQQEIGPAHQGLGQVEPHAPTAGKMVHGLPDAVGLKSETVQKSCGP